jgi:hypothetical protein
LIVREIEISLPTGVCAESIEGTLAEACEQMGLRIGMRSTLAGHRGSLHWHLKRDKERGILEVTFVPEPTRLWLAVHANREGTWIDEAVTRMAALLEDALAHPPPRDAT